MTSVTPALERDWRVPANGPASIRILSPLSLESCKVQIVDASSSGMSMRMSEYLQRGVLVQIRLKASFVLAEVRHCQAEGEGFHVRMEVQDQVPSKMSGI
jgi:hypothetical protein